FFLVIRRPPISTLFPYTRSSDLVIARFRQKFSSDSTPPNRVVKIVESARRMSPARFASGGIQRKLLNSRFPASVKGCGRDMSMRSEEHTSELQSLAYLVCRLLLE